MHSRNPGYQPGNHWMVCDVCGFDYRSSEMRKRWDGAWVCRKDWESRHPQDFVKGRRDKMRVPIARPATPIDTLTTTLSAGASKDTKSISVTSASHISEKDSIGIELTSVIQWTFVTEVSGTTITLNDGLWDDAASWNTVYLGQVSGPTITTPTGVTAADL